MDAQLIRDVELLKREVERLRTLDRRRGVGARVYNDANISTTSGVETALTFNSERYDTDALHSTSSNTGRLTAPMAGYYTIGANVRWAANSTGQRYIYIRHNGATVIAIPLVNAATLSTIQNVSTIWQMATGDYVEVVVFQNSGGNLNVEANAAQSPEFWMHLLDPT